MKFNRRRKATTAEKPSSDHAPPAPRAALSKLTQCVNSMIGPGELWRMPQLQHVEQATDAADAAGRADASSDPFDEMSANPRLSLEYAIVPAVMELVLLIGGRAHDVLAALRKGTLTVKAVPPPPAAWHQEISVVTRVLLVVGVLIEMWLGAQLWERLISADDLWSWLVGLVWGLAIAGGMIVLARVMWEHNPGLLAERGLSIAFGLAALFGFGLAVYAFALAGGAEPETTTVIQGGGPAGSSTSVDAAGVNWVYALVYFGAMALIAAMLVFAHFRDMSQAAKERRRAKREAWSHVLSPEQQRELAIELLEGCMALVADAKVAIRTLAGAYVGGARMALPPELNSMWDSSALEELVVPDPEWVPEIRREIAKLRAAQGDTEPPVLLGVN